MGVSTRTPIPLPALATTTPMSCVGLLATRRRNACGSPPSGATTYGDNRRRSTYVDDASDRDHRLRTAGIRPPEICLCANTMARLVRPRARLLRPRSTPITGRAAGESSTIGSTTTNYTWGEIELGSGDTLTDGTWDYIYVPGSEVPVEQVARLGIESSGDLLRRRPQRLVPWWIVQLTSGTIRTSWSITPTTTPMGTPSPNREVQSNPADSRPLTRRSTRTSDLATTASDSAAATLTQLV